MLHFPTWKVVAIVLTCLAGIIGTAPNLMSKERLAALPSWVPKATIPLGLDLQGGVHLVLEMNVEELKKSWFEQLMDDTRKIVREARVANPSLALTGPVARGDWDTVARHLAALDPSEHDAYRALAAAARRLVDEGGLPPDL